MHAGQSPPTASLRLARWLCAAPIVTPLVGLVGLPARHARVAQCGVRQPCCSSSRAHDPARGTPLTPLVTGILGRAVRSESRSGMNELPARRCFFEIDSRLVARARRARPTGRWARQTCCRTPDRRGMFSRRKGEHRCRMASAVVCWFRGDTSWNADTVYYGRYSARRRRTFPFSEDTRAYQPR